MAIQKSTEWWIGSEPADLHAYLAAFTRSNGRYPATLYRPARCACGSERFELERVRSVTRRVCALCGLTSFICRTGADWDEAIEDEGPEPYTCVNCRSPQVSVTIGFAVYEANPEIDG